MFDIKKIPSISLSIFLSLTSAFAFASAPGGSGGGDSDVIDFLSRGKLVAAWAESHPEKLSFNAPQVRANLNEITSSLQNGEKARLSFTTDEIKDQNGVTKMALYNREENSILVNRALWKKTSEAGQAETAAIELFGLSGSTHRYEEATLLKESFKVADVQCYMVEGRTGSTRGYHFDYIVHNFAEAEKFVFPFSQLFGVDLIVTVGKMKDRSETSFRSNFETIEAFQPKTKKRGLVLDHRIFNSKVTGLDGGSWGARYGKIAVFCNVGNPVNFRRSEDAFKVRDSGPVLFKSAFERPALKGDI